jgi:molecular chaperone GrpE
MNSPEETNTGPVIHDRRRIDPATGQVRDPGQGQPSEAGAQVPGAQRVPGKARPGKHAASKPGGAGLAGTPPAGGPGQGSAPGAPSGEEPDQVDSAATETAEATTMLAERTADLQRVTAEYANYRKRVERDRLAVREQALANVLAGLLPVLDDIGRAREHGELVGGFRSVAESLESIVTKLGLTSFGEVGEAFDPRVHEALMHSYSAEVSEPTAITILQPGYRVGERILRPARVAVAEPTGEAVAGSDEAVADPSPSVADTPGHGGDAGADSQ